TSSTTSSTGLRGASKALSPVSNFSNELKVLFLMIAKALRLIRQYHDLSRIDAARRLDMSKETLIAIESGTSSVTKDVLEMYSAAFEIPVSSLIFFSDSLYAKKGKNANKIRLMLAGKALTILEWIAEKDDKKIEA
uniref:helix-turn-helix domain-containing protein n=1 Tax=Vibrio vulnificus TaxID=672 RepID=UPI001F40748F